MKLEQLLHSSHKIATMLLENKEDSLDRVLEELCRHSEASRTYIFKIRGDFTDNTHEYINPAELRTADNPTGIKAEIDNLKGLPISEFSDFVDILKTEIINAPNIHEYSFSERSHSLLDSQDIKSILVFPINYDGELKGFVGFDECKRFREWEPEIIEYLETNSKSISMFLRNQEYALNLQESNNRFQSINNFLPGTIWETDIGLLFTLSQGFGLTKMGLKPDQVVGMSLYDFFRTDDPSHPAISNHLLALKGKKTYYELTHEGITYASNLQPKFDLQGNICGVVGMALDITKRKQTEMKLTESERRFMDVLYASNDAILLIGDNTFIDCNESTARMLGYATRKEFLQTHPSELSPPLQPDGRNSFEKAEEMMRRAIENGYNRFEWMHRRANGEDFPVEVSLTPIVYEGKKLIYCVWRNITERKQMEEALHKTEHEYETLFYKMLNGFALHKMIYDAHGNPADYQFLAVNPAFEHMTGLRADAIVGRTVLEVLPCTERHWIEIYGKVVLSGEPVLFENYAIEMDKYFEVTAFCPAPGQFACIFQDITERKQVEKQQKIRLDLYKMIADNVEPEQVRQYVDQYKAQLISEETKK